MPSRSVTPGRKPSISTSAFSTIRRTTSRPLSLLRSIAMERLPRLLKSVPPEVSPSLTAEARSTRITSAPRSASSIAANGPGPIPASSITRTPDSGPLPMCDSLTLVRSPLVCTIGAKARRSGPPLPGGEPHGLVPVAGGGQQALADGGAPDPVGVRDEPAPGGGHVVPAAGRRPPPGAADRAGGIAGTRRLRLLREQRGAGRRGAVGEGQPRADPVGTASAARQRPGPEVRRHGLRHRPRGPVRQ